MSLLGPQVPCEKEQQPISFGHSAKTVEQGKVCVVTTLFIKIFLNRLLFDDLKDLFALPYRQKRTKVNLSTRH